MTTETEQNNLEERKKEVLEKFKEAYPGEVKTWGNGTLEELAEFEFHNDSAEATNDSAEVKKILKAREEIFNPVKLKEPTLIERLDKKIATSVVENKLKTVQTKNDDHEKMVEIVNKLNAFSSFTTSELIRKRIEIFNGEDDNNKTFRSNDNIQEFIDEGELLKLQDEIEEKMLGVLQSLVIDVENDHNTKDTAKRVAKMFLNEIFEGRYTPMPKITHFPNVGGYKSIYTTGPISIKSTCAHHLQNINGKCWVGIIPEEDVIGLSKFNRIVHWLAHRPQIQEELTCSIANQLEKYARSPNVAVVLKAEHHCMTTRGVREHESDMTTAVMRGAFMNDPATRNEFYQLLGTMKGIPNG